MRLRAFYGYCQQTPLWRVLGVSLLFSLPAVLTSIALELIPLQNPLGGVKANPGACLRQYFVALIMSLSALVQIGQLVPQLSLSAVQILVTALATSCCYIVVMITLGTYWVYPVPFGEVMGVMPCTLFLILFFLLGIGRQRISSSTSLRYALRQQITIVMAESVLAVVYPLFSVVFHRLSSVDKMFFAVLLPSIKFMMQQFVARAAKDLEDHQPGIVVFCVDVFNAIYAAKTLQSASQFAQLTPFIISGFDMLELLLVVRSLRHQMASVRRLQQHFSQRNTADTTHFSGQPLVDAAMDLCELPEVVSNDHSSAIRYHSSVTYQRRFTIQPTGRPKPKPLDAVSATMSKENTRPSSINRIVPVIVKADRRLQELPGIQISQPQELTLSEIQEQLHVALKLLFECEYHLLVKYVECAVPTMYGIYVAIVQQLPSAQYFPETHQLEAHESQAIMLNLLVYAGLEMFLFLLLHAVIKSRCGFSPTYLLAFVLESQLLELQGRLFLWYIFLLELSLFHFGTAITRIFDY